uniref:EGF-like domain-containing protein n=1 Tax=Romanomermis culicivorax TaxID=13658 RepID=A0A915I9I4_ROMCU
CIDGRCQPYDCLASGLDDCPANARCIERRCQCIEGFRSHGPICLPILQGTTLGGNDVKNDGATQSPDSAKCHSNAACIQNRCQCLDGYVGNGETCVEDPNDCIAVPTLCHPKAICLGRRNCSCLAGYEGDGRDHCYRVAASETAASTTPISRTSGSGSVGRSTE